tara:strand:+ start:164 stop:988 length:825 start_codon:yes stop_codon:yes gene_type:complete
MKIDKDTVVFITGGAQGLGLATAEYLASKGAKIFIVDLDGNKLLKVANQLDLQTRMVCQVCDVSVPEQVESAIDQCMSSFGKIDAVISCAGIAAYSCTYNETLNLELDLDICKNTMNVNYFGSLHLAKYASKAMAKNTPNERGERGVICFTSSVCATEGLQMSLPYSTSKAAINGMVLPMTRDLSHLGIRVNSINAGTFPTNMQINGIKAGYGVNDEEGIKKFQKEFIDRYYPPETYDNLGQGQVEDFGHFVASIIENPFMNGSVLRFDGGMRM